MEKDKPKTQRVNYKKKYELAQGSIKNLENVCDQYLSELKDKDKIIENKDKKIADISTQNIALKQELSKANHTICTLQDKESDCKEYVEMLSAKDDKIESLKDNIADLGDKIRILETKASTAYILCGIAIILLVVLQILF